MREAKIIMHRLIQAPVYQFLKERKCTFSRAGFAGAHRTPHTLGEATSSPENGGAVQCPSGRIVGGHDWVSLWSFDIAGFAGPLPSPDLYRRADFPAPLCR